MRVDSGQFGAIRANLLNGRGREIGSGDGKTALGSVASGLACVCICPLSERLAAKPLPVYRIEKRLRIAVEFQFRVPIKLAPVSPCQDKKGPPLWGEPFFSQKL